MKFLTVLVSIVLGAVVFKPFSESPLKVCRKEIGSLKTISSIGLSPYPIVVAATGKQLTKDEFFNINLVGLFNDSITVGATSQVIIRPRAIPYYKRVDNLCASEENNCKLQGDLGRNQSLHIHQMIPYILLPERTYFEIRVVNGDGSLITCLKGWLRLVSKNRAPGGPETWSETVWQRTEGEEEEEEFYDDMGFE